jgi:hypothetical protein
MSVCAYRWLAKHRVAAAFLALALPLCGQDAESQIRAQLDRVERDLQSPAFSTPAAKNLREGGADLIRGAREALTEHRVYLSLEKLGQLLSSVRGAARGMPQPSADSVGEFQLQWTRANHDLTTLVRQVRQKSAKLAPEALRGIVETSLDRIAPLMAGSEGFATLTSPAEGLFYLGQAQGECEFANFCASLHLSSSGKAVAPRSLLPELQGLQDRVNAAFVPARSVDRHPQFIALNSTLKVARELDASKAYAGSMYQYLEAVRLFGLLEARQLDAGNQAQSKEKGARLRATLDSSKSDDSIAEVFLQRAESLLAHAKTIEEGRSAWVIADQVMPSYFAARKPAAITQQKNHKAIQITLVRWPFT